MTLTKLQARTLVQQLIDDSAAKLWSAANLDILTEAVLDEMWAADLLDHWPYLRSTESGGLTPTAPGYIDTDVALTRFYRLQQITRNSIAYAPADQKDSIVSNSLELSTEKRTYTFYGNQLHLFPYELTPAVFVRYSSRPPTFTSLNDTDAVIWPDGHHLAYIYAIAARAMEKGDREQSERFEKRAETSLLKLKSTLRKQHVGPTMPWMPDTAQDWGGV